MHNILHFLLHASPILIIFIVAVTLLLESTAFPIANSTLLLFTGALASQGHINFWFLLLFAILGSITGACLAYELGKRGGRKILLRLTSFFRIGIDKVEMTERWFQKYGIWMIFISRMTPYIRPFACIPAGIGRLPFERFLLAASAGSIIWCSAMLSIGWMLGRRWKEALFLLQSYTIPTLCVLVLIIGLYFLMRYAIKRYLLAKLRSFENSTH